MRLLKKGYVQVSRIHKLSYELRLPLALIGDDPILGLEQLRRIPLLLKDWQRLVEAILLSRLTEFAAHAAPGPDEEIA